MTLLPLVAKQKDSVTYATASLNIWEGSVRSSKSVCSLIRWLDYVRTGPAGNLVMVGKTERTLKRNVIDVLVDWLGPKRCRYVAGAGELWLLGRRIYIAGANNEAAVTKIQGLTLAGAYVDEAALVPESFWAMLLSRLSIDGAQLFATTNPDNPNHWLMRDFLSRARLWITHDGEIIRDDSDQALDLHRFSFQIADNPSLPAKYVANLFAQFKGLWRKRYLLGQWVIAEGAIYDQFDPTPGNGYVVRRLPAMRDWIVAIDYGTTNPFVAVLIGVGVDERLYVAREWRWDSKKEQRQLTDREYSTALRTWLDELDPPDNTTRPGRLEGARTPSFVFVDPSAASFIVQLHRDGWTHVRGAENTVVDGIRSVASLFAADRLKIHESCRAGIDETVGYSWDEKKAEKGEEAPIKVADHFPDAKRYGVMGARRHWRQWVVVDDELDRAA